MIIETTAVEKIKDILAEENNPELRLRVFVQGGGCSGMQYGFTLDSVQNDDDFNTDIDGISVLVDSTSWQYLHDAKIRYDDGVMGASFVIDNPNAQSTCGCGSSFNPY